MAGLLLLTVVPAVLALVAAARLLLTIKAIQRRRARITASQSSPPAFPAGGNAATGTARTVMVVLGSGGHTAEMLTMLSDIVQHTAAPPRIHYVVGATDNHSAAKAAALHAADSASAAALREADAHFVTLPRAREVGESWLSSVYSSLRTLLAALALVWRTKPDVVLTNGPGTSAIVAAIAFTFRALLPRRASSRVIYVESFARVESLSLSGKLVYAFADRFLVQWQQLRERWPLAEYYGRVC